MKIEAYKFHPKNIQYIYGLKTLVGHQRPQNMHTKNRPCILNEAYLRSTTPNFIYEE